MTHIQYVSKSNREQYLWISLYVNSLQREKTEKGLLRARLLRHFISCRGRWRAESWQRRPIVQWAASHDRMRREAAAAAHVRDLTGTSGTSTWLIDIVAAWRKRASRRGGWVGDGAVTEKAMRFSLTRECDIPQLQITRPQFRDRLWAVGRRNCSS